MKIKVVIYSCYKLTYGRVYKDVLKRIYGDKNIDIENALLEIQDISENGHLSTQSQRSLSRYVTRTIRIYEDDKLKHIVGMSNTNFDYDKKDEFDRGLLERNTFGSLAYHGNTYLKQGTPNIFNYYFSEKKNGVDLCFYLLDTDQSYPHNLFNILSYRELQTIGFRVLNIEKINFSKYEETGCHITNTDNISFNSFNKYMNDISLISKKNRGNTPSFLQFEEKLVRNEDGSTSYYTDKYIYTFKSLSAQQYDSLFKCWCMKVLADNEGIDIEFKLGKQYFNYEADEWSIAQELSEPVKLTFENAGLKIDYETNEAFMQEKARAQETYVNARKSGELRNQLLFRNNIRKKGIPTKCAICNCDNESILDAAHIWEVRQIKNSSLQLINNFIKINDLSDLIDQTNEFHNELFYKKYQLTNCGDNGLWLCKNHHGLFDKNYYCFDSENGKIILHFDNQSDIDELSKEIGNIEDYQLPEDILTSQTKAFISQRQTYFNP